MHFFDSIKILYIYHMALIWSNNLQRVNLNLSTHGKCWLRRESEKEREFGRKHFLIQPTILRGVLIGVFKIVQTIWEWFKAPVSGSRQYFAQEEHKCPAGKQPQATTPTLSFRENQIGRLFVFNEQIAGCRIKVIFHFYFWFAFFCVAIKQVDCTCKQRYNWNSKLLPIVTWIPSYIGFLGIFLYSSLLVCILALPMSGCDWLFLLTWDLTWPDLRVETVSIMLTFVYSLQCADDVMASCCIVVFIHEENLLAPWLFKSKILLLGIRHWTVLILWW